MLSCHLYNLIEVSPTLTYYIIFFFFKILSHIYAYIYIMQSINIQMFVSDYNISSSFDYFLGLVIIIALSILLISLCLFI